MEKEESMKKGPWTEQEDVQLVLYVNLFGDRRWDFIAKVSGLKRTGKSCRLRWVNYLHPGLKRGKMTPHEENLVLHLHAKWGNRWSRIARKLPGRTDNEIKNYWRSHMRKLAQDQRKKGPSSSSSSFSSSPSSSSSSLSISSPEEDDQIAPITDHMQGLTFCDVAADGVNWSIAAPSGEKQKSTGVVEVDESSCKVYSMETLWKEFEFSQEMMSNPETIMTVVESQIPAWEYCCPLWSMDDPNYYI